MTAVVQTVVSNGLGGVTNSKTFTLSPTQSGNSIIITMAIEGGSTAWTGATITDDKSNSYSSTDFVLSLFADHSAAIFYVINATAGVTSVTVTTTGGSGGLYGVIAVQEVSGITALDKHAGGNSPSSSPLTLNNSGTNTGTADFVTTAIAVGNGASNVGLSNPPSGYTTSAISQNDSTDASGACAYRIDTSAVTDSVTWAATNWEPGDPAVIASFVGAAGGGVALTGQASTSAAGSVGPSITVGLAGQSATFTQGALGLPQAPLVGRPRVSGPGISPDFRSMFAPRALSSALNANVTVALTGSAGTFATGSLAHSSTTALTGQQATFSAGTVTQSAQAALTGQAVTSAVGAVFAASQIVVTGQSMTASPGIVTAPGNVSIGLTGQGASFAAGAIAPSLQVGTTGQPSTFAAGTLVPAMQRAATGSSAAFSTGLLGAAVQIPVVGQPATFSAGNVTAPNGVTMSLTGQAATFAAGSLTPSASAALSGQSALTAAGSVATGKAAAITGSGLTTATGTLLASIAIPAVGQSATFATGLLLPPGDKVASLTGSSATFHAGTIIPIGAVLVGSERYLVQRPRKRVFTVSACTFRDFPPKDPAESIPLTFDFEVDLEAGVTLSGTPTVTVTMSSGADATPANIFNGLPRFDITSTQVIVPVIGGLANCDYDIKVVVPTTDSLTILALSGILPVRA